MTRRAIPFLVLAALLVAMLAASSQAFAGEISLRYDFAAPRDSGSPVPIRIARVLLPPRHEAVSVEVETEWGPWTAGTPFAADSGVFSLLRGASAQIATHKFVPETEVVGTHRLAGASILFVRLVAGRVDGERSSTAASVELRVTTRPTTTHERELPFRGLATDVARIRALVDNPEELDRYAQHESRADAWDMLIVTTPDMANTFNEYATYKTETFGLATHVALIDDILAGTSGVDMPDKLRNFVRNAYENHDTRYLILGGDADGLDPAGHLVPARCLWAHAESVTNACVAGDLYFGNLDGTWDDSGDGVYGEPDDGEGGGEVDLLAEVFVGRIAADDAVEAARQLDKIRAYDAEDPRLAAILYGEKLWPAPPVWGDDLKDLAFAEMPGFAATRMYGRDGTYTADGLVEAINSDEHSIINASEHGNWYNGLGLYMIDLPPVHDQLPEIANTYPFLGYSHGCYTGSFDNRTVIGTYNARDAIAEELTTGMEAGAFAMIVNSREGFADWSDTGGASSEFDIAFMHEVFANNVTALGEALAAARETFIGALDDNEGANRWIFLDLNLLGDPHESFKTSVPGPDDDADDDVVDDDATDDDATPDDDATDGDVDDDATPNDDGSSGSDDDDSGCGC